MLCFQMLGNVVEQLRRRQELLRRQAASPQQTRQRMTAVANPTRARALRQWTSNNEKHHPNTM